jgi:hypothetical protein
MFLGMAMLFCLFTGLVLVFGANFLQGRDKMRALMIVVGAGLSMIPLVVFILSFFYPIWE